jgi:hypothetical protein
VILAAAAESVPADPTTFLPLLLFAEVLRRVAIGAELLLLDFLLAM